MFDLYNFSQIVSKLVILADYTRYKAKHQGSEEAIEDHEHDSINEIYFSFYRIAGKLCHADSSFHHSNHLSVYIWTLLGLSWLGGLISLIVDSASKVALKTRPDTDSIEYKLDCGRYVNNVRVVLGRNGSQPNNTTTQQPNNSRENNIVMATRNFPNYKAPPDVVNQSGQLKKTKNTNFKNREEKNCIICSESEHLCKQHRILLDP